jgi:cytochrome c-type biogenesis protein CcmH
MTRLPIPSPAARRKTSTRSVAAALPTIAGARALAVALLLCIALPAAAPALAQSGPYIAPGTTETLIKDPADKARYDKLAHELRCLVCQNQTLADSDASLAIDLRRQLESMIIDGRSDDEIKAYLVQRYGDFVLYRPPMQSNTWLLWFGPFALLAIGIAIWFGLHRRRKPAGAVGGVAGVRTETPRSTPEGGGATTAADLERVSKLLDRE